MRILLLLVVDVLSVVLSQTISCTEEKVCSAICDGKKIDVAFLYNKLIIEDDRGYEYGFSCNGDVCGGKNISTAICQKKAGDDSADGQSCGASNTSVWTVLATEPYLIINVNYTEGDQLRNKPRTSRINITVDPLIEEDVEVFTKEDGDGNYLFNFTVRSLSPLKNHKRVTEGYIGWTLIALSVIGFISYLIIGSIVLYVRKGARGIEIIPNILFWKILPFLLKDGFIFMISPCYNYYRKGYEKI